MKMDPCLSPCTKLKSKWIKDLNTKPYTLNLTKENMGMNLELTGTGGKLPEQNTNGPDFRSTIDKCDLMKLKFL